MLIALRGLRHFPPSLYFHPVRLSEARPYTAPMEINITDWMWIKLGVYMLAAFLAGLFGWLR